MYQPLHLKYRPKNLQELVGQDTIKTTLTNAITDSKIARAYLFTGPRGTGKTSTARILAKSLNCLNSKKPTATPCGECSNCKTIDSSSNLDVTEIDAASHNGVDDARELIEHSNFAPAMSRYRIWILDECHQLSTSAQNALLKCLEEPPAHVVFILCTTEAHKVLPTIISRCQTFNFRALPVDAIVGQLQKISDAESIAITIDSMRAIARISDGGLRDALQLLSQLSLLHSEITLTQVAEVSGSISEQDSIALLKAIYSGDTLSVLLSARTLIDSGKTPKIILSSLLTVMRDLLVVKSTRQCQNLIAGAVSYSQLRSLALHLDFETINAACTQLQKSEIQLRTSTNAATWLEVCLLNLMLSNKSTVKETISPATSQSNRHDKFDRTPQKLEADSPDFDTTWAQVVAAAKPGNRALLNRAKIAELSADSCVLAVERKYANKFQSHLESVQRIVTKALGRSVTVTVKQQEKLAA
ncbi:DNA polymerase III, subunits gamma and tau (plasmid) [Oscillatoria nigro-viridis PCC 7112]|uniref:DNA polymerase III subunit gamma/tau n=1 Tax=Phormidium nigroviride PCC 7112 TaxID=179408 RepID=K9VSA3_9CYAN|nr:DNA polymerase III subunit gamma/tau [Oscillatoria nigro-viridis]AFZ10948.1 DNA polymerase III, subunits gamma and tau [Oscillatoria nigro-viridis PCC 7112]